MVFESVVVDLLNKILGDYVENLDKKQLKIGIWGGDVVLNNLRLRENALDELDLPVQIVYGFLGKLVLKIPWKNLYSQPVVAQIEDLYILVSPKTATPYNEEKEQKYDLQYKQAAMLAIEESHKQALIKDKPKPDATFAEKLTAQIVNNLQVKITNVHLRYEDCSTTGQPLAFGATLHDLEIYTCDKDCQKCYVTEQVSRVFKIANLDSLAVYMNCVAELYSIKESSQLSTVFRDHIGHKERNIPHYAYVLGPISLMTKLCLNMNPEYDSPPFQIPKIDLGIEMDLLNVGLTGAQFKTALHLAEYMNRLQLGTPYRKYRPFDLPYKNHYKTWWEFAITAILEHEVKRKNEHWTWAHIKEHRRLCNQYAEKYKEKALSKKPSPELIEECTDLEKRLDLFNLLLIWQRVQIEVAKVREEQAVVKPKGWFSWWGGGDKSDEENSGNIVRKLEAAMTPAEKEKLYKAIGYQETSVPLNLPEEYEAIHLNFELKNLEIALYDDSSLPPGRLLRINLRELPTILLLRFNMTKASVQQRPAANAIKFTADMKEMKLIGYKQDEFVPIIIESKISDDLNLLDLSFETNPLDKGCHQRIKLYARPLQIVYDSETVLKLTKVYAPQKSHNLSELEMAAQMQMANLKERSTTGMQYMIDQQSVLEVDIKLMPNLLILPYEGVYKPGDTAVIVVSLGRLRVHSLKRQKDVDVSQLLARASIGGTLDSINGRGKILVEGAYDTFRVNIDNLQVLVAKRHERWEDVLVTGTTSKMHVLYPTSLKVEAHLCLLKDDPRLSSTIIDVVLPSININISENRTFEAIGVVTSIPLPEKEVPPPGRLVKSPSMYSSRLSLASFMPQGKRRNSSAKPKPDSKLMSDEVVQLTTLEVYFTLNKIELTLYKSCDSNAVQSSNADDSPTDSTKFGTPTEDVVEEFVDSSSVLESAHDGQKLLKLEVLQLEAFMTQRTHELLAIAKLGAIRLNQYDHCENTDSKISIINTPRYIDDTNEDDQSYLFTVEYTMSEKTAPDFATVHNSVEQLIVVNFSILQITLHQEYLLRLLAMVDNFQRKLEELLPPEHDLKALIPLKADINMIGKLHTIAEDAESIHTRDTPQRKPHRQHKVVESIKIKVEAKMEQVGLLLTTNQRELASLKVKHFHAGLTLKSSYTQLNLRLKDITVLDLNPQTIHSNVLSIVGQDAFDCQVVMYNLDETANYNSDDMNINVDVGCIKLVFLNWFVTGVMSFLNHFQAAQQALAQASAAAAESAKVTAMDAYEKATRMKLKIRVKAPIIVVPVDSQSRDGIALDLGLLLLTNTISETDLDDEGLGPVVVDDIKLELNNIKISKVAILTGSPHDNVAGISLESSIDTIDSSYGLKSDVNILDPMSFTLGVKRNLSSTWYHDIPEIDLFGRLKSVKLNLFKEDYSLIMSILSRNMKEGASEFPPPEIKPPKHAPAPLRKNNSGMPRKDVKKLEVPKLRVHEQLKFNFLFDGVIANIIMNNNDGLARFGLYFVSVKGNKLIDGTLSASVILCNLQLDDTRPNTKSKITQYLCRKDWLEAEKFVNPVVSTYETCFTDPKSMVDATVIIKESDTFAEVRVSGFDLILCIDFLLELATFFALPKDEEPIETPEIAKNVVLDSKLMGAQSSMSRYTMEATQNKMNLTLHIEEPDIILIESLEDINTNAIIFNAQAKLTYRVIGDKQLINGQIDALKMYMCSFMPKRREATKHYIIHPCVISLQGSTPEEEGLHISLKLSEIIINISPATIELFNKAMQTISASTAEKTAIRKAAADYSKIWNAKKFKDKEFWFVKVETAAEAFEVLELTSSEDLIAEKTEKCIIEVPSITVVVETGVGYYTTPLIMFDTHLDAVASNWSRNLSVNGSLTLNMNYYNQALAVWEPIIEMNEHLNRNGEQEYLPWELNFGLAIETKKSEFDEDTEEKTTKIKIHSDENLELTMSKTCLNVLNVLGEAFSQAIQEKGLYKPEVIAPYAVENDTGFDITLNFSRGIFTLHECHMPRSTSPAATLNTSLVFQGDGMDADVSGKDVKNCTVSAGGRVYLQTKDLSTITSAEDEEYTLYVKVGDIDKEIVLPVSKSDSRYFPLARDTHQDPWGVISEVKSEYGTTVVNIHGVLNVFNYFTASVQIYRRKPNTMEKVLIGEVAPNSMFHVPLHAIYSSSKELYFALDGYRVSIQGIKWNDCPTDLLYQRQIQCDPANTFEPFYINALREKTEVYFENTNKFKLLSAYYTISIRPPLYLCNALPISIKVSVAGCSVRSDNSEHKRVTDENSENPENPDYSVVKEDLLDYGEKEVYPGHVLHLPTVKLTGKSREGKSYLVVRLIQYLEKDWSCTTEITENRAQLAIWKFSSYDSSAKMDMDLCVRFEDRKGSVFVSLYSPFWMINKTGRMLSYKADTETVEVLYHPPEYKGPILFSFREKFFFDKKAASIRIDNGDWSSKIPLDVAGSVGEVTCKTNDMSYQIGVHNHLTNNSLTKQITFIPFYIASNKCSFPIELQEQSRPGDPWTQIEPDACVPIWPRNDSDHLIVARVEDQRTAAFNYSDAQCTLLQLANNKYGGLNVDVQTTEGGIYITFTEYNPGDAPGLFINHSSKDVTYYEKGRSTGHILQPHQKVLYTWADPAGEKLLVFGSNKVETDLRRDGVGQVVLSDGTKAYWVSFLDGLQRVLLLTEIESLATKTESSAVLQTITQSIEVSIHGIGLSVVNNETNVDILYLGIASSGIIWENKRPDKKRFKQMSIQDTALMEGLYQQYLIDRSLQVTQTYLLEGKHEINFTKMRLMKSGERELKRSFHPGIWICMDTSPFQTQLHARINKVQLDNQLPDFIFPVVLAPIAPPKSVASSIVFKPFVECSVVQRLVPNSTVKQFKYARMLIQEFHFKVDLLFLTAIVGMFSGNVTDEQAAKLFNQDVESIENPLSQLVATQTSQEQKHFYDNLHLGPLKIHVSFSMAGSDTTALPGILSTLVQGVGVTLTDVNDVVFRLAFFEREYQFFTQRQLISEIQAHYTGQALKQLYVLVLGLDVLGNPYGLVVGLKKGVEDLFYEPFQGAIQGPGEFAEGLVLGVKSLFGHTVGGAAGAVSKITGAMGKGLAVLTFDEDYQKKRRQNMNKKPANFHEGIARSGKGLVMGFVDGVTGVVTKPVAGAREEGVEGFFKGLGKGAIGLVARPTAGIVDFASGSLDAVKRAAETNQETNRLRPPRFLHQDNVLRPYCREEAEGNKMLREIEKGKYASTDTFAHCEEIGQRHEYFIVTNHRVIYVTRNELFGTWTTQWHYLWHEIASIAANDHGVEITLKKEGKKVMGFFTSHEPQRKLLLIPQKKRRDKLVEIMESHRKLS